MHWKRTSIVAVVTAILMGGLLFLINEGLKPSKEDVESYQETAKYSQEMTALQERAKRAEAAIKRAEKGVYGEGEVQLALLNLRGSWDDGFWKVEGRVKNVSTEPLHNVTAVASWYDNNGEFIKSEDALIEFDPMKISRSSGSSMRCSEPIANRRQEQGRAS